MRNLCNISAVAASFGRNAVPLRQFLLLGTAGLAVLARDLVQRSVGVAQLGDRGNGATPVGRAPHDHLSLYDPPVFTAGVVLFALGAGASVSLPSCVGAGRLWRRDRRGATAA